MERAAYNTEFVGLFEFEQEYICNSGVNIDTGTMYNVTIIRVCCGLFLGHKFEYLFSLLFAVI